MATLFRPRPHTLQRAHRAFSTTPPLAVSLQLDRNDADSVSSTVPAYPYGPARWYKQSRLGLYGGQRIRFGNNVGEKIEVKTRRTWQPNVLTRKLFSKALNRVVQVRVTTRVLRTIDKLGGLDEYLLGEKEGRVRELGESGWWLRWAIMQTPAIKRRFAEERRRLGVPEEVLTQEETEVAEAQAVIDEATDVEAEAAADVGEAVGTDGAFVVEQPPGMPPLKFRVGPQKHLILTADGWRRTRPDPTRLPNLAKERIFNILWEKTTPSRESDFVLQLSSQQEKLSVEERLSAGEQAQLLREARTEWREELKEQAAAMYERKIALREARKGERKARKREERSGMQATKAEVE